MPYKNKEDYIKNYKQRSLRKNPIQTTTCTYCGIEHQIKGNTKRKSKICSSCYPFHRRAVNLYSAARYRANKLNLPIDISVDWVFWELFKGCMMLGVPFEFNSIGKNIKHRHPLSPSLDRIVPELGYTTQNTRVVCWWYNVTKQQYSDKDVYDLCKQLVNFSEMKLAHNAENLTETEMAIT